MREKDVKFIIFGRGRSGTTALVSFLNSHPKIHCDGEILHQYSDAPYSTVIEKYNKSKLPVYGCKILSYQIRDVQPILNAANFLQTLHEDGFKIIYLKRENLLFHAISNIRARIFDFHSRTSDTKNFGNNKIKLDFVELLKWLQGSESLTHYESSILKNIPYLPLSYEKHIENSKNHQKMLIEIYNFLNIEYKEGTTELKKISPRSLQDSIENYDELVNFLKETPYFEYLL